MKKQYQILLFSLAVVIAAASTHWLWLLSPERIIGISLKQVSGQTEWVLVEDDIRFSLNKQGIFLGDKGKGMKIMDFGQIEALNLTEQREGQGIDNILEQIKWEKSGYQYKKYKQQTSKLLQIRGIMEKTGMELNLFLDFNGNPKRVELKQGELDLGFWINPKQ